MSETHSKWLDERAAAVADNTDAIRHQKEHSADIDSVPFMGRFQFTPEEWSRISRSNSRRRETYLATIKRLILKGLEKDK